MGVSARLRQACLELSHDFPSSARVIGIVFEIHRGRNSTVVVDWEAPVQTKSEIDLRSVAEEHSETDSNNETSDDEGDTGSRSDDQLAYEDNECNNDDECSNEGAILDDSAGEGCGDYREVTADPVAQQASGSEERCECHGVTWILKGEGIVSDPRIKRHPNQCDTSIRMKDQSDQPIDFWNLFWPTRAFTKWVKATNSYLKHMPRSSTEAAVAPLSKQELRKFIGIMLWMSGGSHHNRREYWKTKGTELYPASNAKKIFGISR